MRRERRRTVRSDYNALVTITIDDGLARGASYVGLLRNLSDGGIGVLLDCASLRRGTSVTVGIEGLPAISARVCHCTALDEGTLVGVSFAYADVPVDNAHWRAVLKDIITCPDAAESRRDC